MIRTTGPLVRHHHFRDDLIDPSDPLARLEARMVAELVDSKVGDESRDSSIAFELKHSAAVVQFARLLAHARGLPPSVCAAGALLHDIFVVVTGSYDNHAVRGGPIAEAWISDVGGFSNTEVQQALEIVTYHSEKHVWTDEPFIEFGKDVDVLDCFLYPDAMDEYLMVKPLDIAQQYLRRAQRVWMELGLPKNYEFDVLNSYSPDGWLAHRETWSRNELSTFLANATVQNDPFVIVPLDETAVAVHFAKSPNNRPSDEPTVAMHPLASVSIATAVWPALAKHEELDAVRAAALGVDCDPEFLVASGG